MTHEAHFCLSKVDLGLAELQVNFSCSLKEPGQVTIMVFHCLFMGVACPIMRISSCVTAIPRRSSNFSWSLRSDTSGAGLTPNGICRYLYFQKGVKKVVFVLLCSWMLIFVIKGGEYLRRISSNVGIWCLGLFNAFLRSLGSKQILNLPGLGMMIMLLIHFVGSVPLLMVPFFFNSSNFSFSSWRRAIRTRWGVCWMGFYWVICHKCGIANVT